MAERSIQEKFKEIGLNVSGGETVTAPLRVLVGRDLAVRNRQQLVANEILTGEEAKFSLDPVGLRLLLSQGVGVKGIIEFPSSPGNAPYIDKDGKPKRAFATIHPDSDEEQEIIRLKVFASSNFWIPESLNPRREQAVSKTTVDDVIGATATLGRGGHKEQEGSRGTVEAAQPAHTALVLGTSFAASRPLEKVRQLTQSEAPHYVDKGLKVGGNGFTPELAPTTSDDPRAISGIPETLYPAINIDRMEKILNTHGQGLNPVEKGEYNFYAFLANCQAIVSIDHLDSKSYASAMNGELILPRATNPESVITYQAELFLGLAKKGEAAVEEALKTMETRNRLTQW